jgi:FkbM family methyltransferase
MHPSSIENTDSQTPARLRVARWLGHQRWIPRGHVSLVRLLCSPDAAPDFNFEVNFYGLRYAGNLQNYLDWAVFFFGAHAKSELEVMAHAAECLRSSRRPVVYVDVGANVGHHLLFMSVHADQGYGFEPWSPAVKRARALLALNRISNSELFPVALGEANELRRYYPPRTSNQGSGSFVEDWFDLNDHEAAPVFLDVRKGDEFLKSVNIGGVGIVKIDVEGSEASVCRGLRETIQRDRPFVLLEISGRAARDFGSEQNLRGCLYDNAHIFRLSGGRHKTHLEPYCFDKSLNNRAHLEEVLIVPPEHSRKFTSSLRRVTG